MLLSPSEKYELHPRVLTGQPTQRDAVPARRLDRKTTPAFLQTSPHVWRPAPRCGHPSFRRRTRSQQNVPGKRVRDEPDTQNGRRAADRSLGEGVVEDLAAAGVLGDRPAGESMRLPWRIEQCDGLRSSVGARGIRQSRDDEHVAHGRRLSQAGVDRGR